MIADRTRTTANLACAAPAQTITGNLEPSADTARSAATLGDDLLRGAEEIAAYVFGDPRLRRRVYHLTGDARMRMPHFRIGAIICARKSTLKRWIDRLERGEGSEDAAP